MPNNLCLSRQCLGLVTRVECTISPVAGANGLWTLLCAAGLDGSQPTAIRVQGPFRGLKAAEAVLEAIGGNLLQQGYCEEGSPAIWQLHMRAELRKVNADQARFLRGWETRS